MEGRGTTQSCRAVERHEYWNEFEPTRHNFFKVMVGDFRTQMRVPKKFMKEFREELSEFVSLSGPSDMIERVRLARTNRRVVFCSGWEEFVGNHNISEGDFLVFHYAGNETFNVGIVDMSCSERGAYFTKKHTESCSNGSCVLNNKDGEDPEEIIDLVKMEEEGDVEDTKLSTGRRKGIELSVGSRGMKKEKIEGENAERSGFEDPRSSKQIKRPSEAKRNASPEIEVPASAKGAFSAATIIADKSADEQGIYCKLFLSNRRPVTEEEKKKAMQLAIQHISSRPHFHLVMKATSVSKLFSLAIPKNWACCNISEGIHRVELRVPPNKERWTVRLLQTKQGCRLTKGWYKFVWDNNLEQDDACVFEISEGCASDPNQVLLRFSVTIYRVVDEIVPLTQLLKHRWKG